MEDIIDYKRIFYNRCGHLIPHLTKVCKELGITDRIELRTYCRSNDKEKFKIDNPPICKKCYGGNKCLLVGITEKEIIKEIISGIERVE